MSFQIERDAMLGALKKVADVVEARNTIPVLSNVLMVAEAGMMTLTATNLDLQATATAPAAVETPVSITADKNKLVAAVQSLPAGTLTVAIEPHKLTIRQKRSVRTISTLPAVDFPNLKDPENAKAFALPAAVLARMFGACGPAMSSEETRYYLNGVFVHLVDRELRFAATDGHRLIRATAAAPEDLTKIDDATIPRKTVTMMSRLLDKVEAEVSIQLGPKSIRFAFGDTVVISKLVDGNFPDYSRVIPPEGGSVMTMTLAREALVEPAAAVGAVVNAEGDKLKSRAIAIDCKADGDHEIRARDSTGALAVEPLDVTCGGDKAPFMFGVNQAYLLQVSRIFAESATLSLSLADSNAPVRMTSDKDPDLLAVLMPMRV